MGNFKNFFLSVTTHQMKKRTLMKKWKFLYLLTKILVCRKLTFNNPTTFLNIPSERLYWMLEHDQHWFERLWEHKNETIFEELWKCEFWLKIETFQFAVNLVKNDMECCNTFWWNTIAVEKQVAVAIWCLWTGNSFQTVSKVFGTGLSTSSEICMKFCRIMSKLPHNFIKFPQNDQETALAMRRFQAITNSIIMNIVGVINRTHVEITCPDTESRVDYYSQKQKYTINTQGVVRYNLLFLDSHWISRELTWC